VPKQILIVDDSSDLRRMVRCWIEEKTDWKVCGEAENGKVAVRLAHELQPDLVLLDLVMPVMNGLEAARHILLLLGASGQVPTLALSALPSPEQVTHCLAAGMDGHVPKPVDYETLMREIDDKIAPSDRNLSLIQI